MRQDYALLSSIKKFGAMPGKKALHKVHYFANQKTDLFTYTWRNWGPFAPEIQQFYDDAYMDNVISVHEQSVQNSGILYNIQLGEKGSKLLEDLEQNPELDRDDIDDAVDSAVDLLGGKTPRMMEVMASAHYIFSYYGSCDAEKIWKTISELKPEAQFTRDDVQGALDELRKKRLV